MVYIVNVLSFLFAWLFKRVSLSLAFLPPKIFIFSMFMFGIGLLITALTSFFYFITTIVNNLFDLFDKIKNTSTVSGVSGSAYGVSLSSILNAFWGFLNASGLLDAFNTALSLFFTLLFSYVSIRIMFTFYNLWMSLVRGLTEQVNSFESSIK